jgi:hypothetical protein
MKKLITAYTFNPAAKTITLTGHVSVDIKGLLLITNVTDNVIIYNFADPAKSGTVTGNIITLTYDTSGMGAGDDLQIFYEDAVYDHLTNSELRDEPVPVSGTFFPETQPVSGPLTDSELREEPIPVSGDFYQATQPVSGPLTDAELRESAIPVSLSELPLPAEAAKDGTDINTPTAMPAGGAGIRGWLSAIWTKLNGAITVTGTFWQTTQPVSGTFYPETQPVSGVFYPATQPVSAASLPLPSGAATSAKQDDIVEEISNKDIMLALKMLVQVLANPAYVDKSANQLRAQVTGSMTTVTTVTGLTNLGGYPAQQSIIDQNRAAWAAVVRSRIT